MRKIYSSNDRGEMRYQHRETVTDATSAPLGMPNDGNDRLVVVSPGVVAGDTCRIEFTASSAAAIENSTATWVAWSLGNVTALSSLVFSGRVTALRLVSVGIGTWEVSA